MGIDEEKVIDEAALIQCLQDHLPDEQLLSAQPMQVGVSVATLTVAFAMLVWASGAVLFG